MTWKRPIVLVVEDDEEMRNLLYEELWAEGYRLREARDGDEAYLAMIEFMPDLVLTDLRMRRGGLDYLSRLRTVAPSCPILVITAFADARAGMDITRAGATAFMNKPMHLSELKERVKELLAIEGQ